ncbi:CPBP family intramembrane glutamic endopeptidase [Mogibacterium pumilum]|nr:CPBP family intramembrane glutamic endopeptidase [Mogibacterium pumilum]
MSTNRFIIKRLLFLLLPFMLLFVYDVFADIIVNIMQKAFTVLSVTDNFVNSSTSFMDASIAFILSIIFYIFYRIIFTKKKPEVIISKPQGAIYSIIIGLGAGGISSIWLNGIYYLADYSPFLAKQIKGFDTLYDDMEKGAYIWLFLAIVVIGPIIEEILFRGIIFSSFENVTGISWLPVIITGVMFGVWHGSFIQGVYTAIVGIILTYYMKKCRSLVYVAIAHGVNNLSGTLPPSLDTDFNNMLLNVMAYVCILPMLVILYHLHRKSKNRVQLTTTI